MSIPRRGELPEFREEEQELVARFVTRIGDFLRECGVRSLPTYFIPLHHNEGIPERVREEVGRQAAKQGWRLEFCVPGGSPEPRWWVRLDTE